MSLYSCFQVHRANCSNGFQPLSIGHAGSRVALLPCSVSAKVFGMTHAPSLRAMTLYANQSECHCRSGMKLPIFKLVTFATTVLEGGK